ncbi:glycosyl transferase family 28 [Terrimonas sp.]|uniref:glycosyltransferase n=1 Tax=Terrimonas sp. TaxID=1914338 RepID=UPI000D51DC45|nr:glycosyltransferase [Terrimonas sp.]PVD51093.1 glycosyl transferase family 28 [Terrimonas sp.]
MEKRPKILVAPLDWGLGHLTRCIPIVNELIIRGWEVWLAGNERGLAVMRKEFPQLSTVYLEGYNVIYHPSKKGFSLKIIKQLPKILGSIKAENRWLKNILKKHRFDAVISDNRFGLYNSAVYTIFISHQLHVKSGMGKWADSIVQKINYRYISRFNECWVPDYPGKETLSGELSHGGPLPGNLQYIGAISRFEKMNAAKKYDVLIVLSGPEPGRTNWEKKLLKALPLFKGKICFVRGLPENNVPPVNTENAAVFNHLSARELNFAIAQSEWVICRSGYTSIMDLVSLQHKAILVPTPGQPEQEYLAAHLFQKKIFYTTTEDAFMLQHDIAQAQQFPFDFSGLADNSSHYKNFIQRLTEIITSQKNETGL